MCAHLQTFSLNKDKFHRDACHVSLLFLDVLVHAEDFKAAVTPGVPLHTYFVCFCMCAKCVRIWDKVCL